MSLLECRNLNVSYQRQNGEILHVLKGINLRIEEGEILSILGPSGCGKTTLLNCLSAFHKDYQGELLYKNQAMIQPSTKRQVIFQDNHDLLPWLNVTENILFPVQRSYLPGFPLKISGSLKDKVNHVLELVGLQDFSSYHPDQLSGGMRQRCALGRALMADAEVLFMDEPFGALDAPSRRELQDLLLTLWQQQKFTIVFVTHDIREAIHLADRILLMSKPAEAPQVILPSLERPRCRDCQETSDLEWSLYSILAEL